MAEVYQLATWQEIRKRLDSRRRWRRIRALALIGGIRLVMGLGFWKAGVG